MLLQETVTALDNLLNVSNEDNWQQLMMVCVYKTSVDLIYLHDNDCIIDVTKY